ncbi:MAG: preprotein translocase subunit YajC [Planctomycetes bacterium]|nr:preprotein translocase subunit YajC [Planctomycetota bacterium]
MQLLPLFVIMYLIFWLLVIRPQRKQQRARQEMLSNLKKNDKVLTSGGIIGTILQIRDNEVTLKIDDSCRVRLLRSAVTDVIRDRAEGDKKEQGD